MTGGDFSKIFTKTLSKQEIFARALFERPDSLSQFLTYDEYLSEFGVFRQKDGSIGVIYEATPCEHETKTSLEIVSLLEKLRSWFRLDDSLTLSIHFDQARISEHDPIWEQYAIKQDYTRGDLPAKLHLAQLERLKSSGIPSRRRLFLSIRSFEKRHGPMAKLQRFGSELGNPHRTLSSETERFIRQVRDFNHSLSQFEMLSPLPLRRLNASALADFLRRIFNPVTYYKRPFATINSDISLSNQVIFCPSEIDYPGMVREGIRTRTITLKNAPSFAYPGAMAYFLSLDFPFRISLNISFPKTTVIKRHFGVKEFFLQNTPSARSRRQKAEVEELQERLLRDDRVLHMTFCVLIEAGTEEELDLRTKECLARFQQRLECEAIVEKEIGFGLWLNALPLNYHPIADYTTKRAIRILASDIVQFCPIFDSFRGTETAQSIFLSRENGLVPFSIKSHGNSHMMAVLGDTGASKSAQVIKLLQGELRQEPKPLIFVIDHKTSYGMVSQYLPSELTTFEQGKPMPFSPFRGALDDDKLGFLVQLLTAAMQLTSSKFLLDSEHRTCLMQAIRAAYENKTLSAGVQYVNGKLMDTLIVPQAMVTLDDIVAQIGGLTGVPEFEKYGSFVDEITKKLRPFYGDGIYAPFFKTANSPPSSKQVDLYVYDLDALSGDPILQTLVAMCIFEEVRRIVNSTAGKQRGGYVVLEEFRVLGEIPIAKDFAITAAETFRKLGFYLIPLTPNPRNYFETLVGQALWAAADHFFFLEMKEDNVDYVAKHSNLLDEASVQIVKSLRTIRGKYADLFYVHKSKAIAGAFRSIPSALELWLTPTHRPDSLEAQKTLRRFHGNPIAALEELVRRYPQGTTDLQGTQHERAIADEEPR